MFGRLVKFFRKAPTPVTFYSESLGDFVFERGIGWTNRVIVGNRPVKLRLGSDGGLPSDRMIATARYWIEHWAQRRKEINRLIASQMADWPEEEDRPDPRSLEIESFYVLWPDDPDVCMVHFAMQPEGECQYHCTFRGREPVGFAFDH